MAKQINLTAEVRQDKGKEKVKKLRSQGMIPAVLYGKGAENQTLMVNNREFVTTLKKSEARLNSIIKLTIKNGGQNSEETVLISQHQTDPITDKFLHLDFLKIDTKLPITTKVPLRIIGESPAIKLGFVLEQLIHDVTVKCLPLDIPNYIEIDVSKLTDGHQGIKAGDLVVKDVTIMTAKDQLVVHTIIPRALKIEEEKPAEAVAAEGAAEGAAPAEGAAKTDDKKGGAPAAEKGAAPAGDKGAKPAAKAEDKKGK